jgi:hypothetical protein
MDANLRNFVPGLVVAAVGGLLVAAFALRPILRGITPTRASWVQLAAVGVALVLLVPTAVLIFDQTQYFRARDLTEVGSAAFEEPPVPETVARSLEDAIRPRESWASVTKLGRCADVDLYLFYWLAFRLAPDLPDCAHPDVELFWKVPPPRGATIIARGDDYAVVRP